MNQTTIFASPESLELANESWLLWARGYAKSYAMIHGSVTSDHVREECDRTGLQPLSVKAFGAVFKAEGWTVIGREPSRYASNNKRWICRWRYQP